MQFRSSGLAINSLSCPVQCNSLIVIDRQSELSLVACSLLHLVLYWLLKVQLKIQFGMRIEALETLECVVCHPEISSFH
jgi:hypothetical protein